jgi:hypothetical protein
MRNINKKEKRKEKEKEKEKRERFFTLLKENEYHY